ncbi:MAG: Glutamine--fructose-6-phosphate aminotransferase [Verrucomicrobiota bacterium]|jgi:glucosamine--fructose-6-phosphate aminotransferase (isomerizing)
MCGIVGYVGDSDAVPFLLEGLGRLEYRGYDSAGAAVLNHGKIEIRKAVGHVAALVEEVKNHPVSGTSGISHTRWATHGGVTLENAHPHRDASGKLALVHNGVVENHKDLRTELESRGHVFASQTDTEVISRLIGEAFDGHGDKSHEALVEATREALQKVRGTYAIGVLHEDLGDFLLAARRGSPLALGLGDGGQFLASDPAAIAGWASDFVYLNEGEIAWLDGRKFEVAGIDGSAAAPVVVRSMEKAVEAGKKGEFAHFMQKEIHEQPETLREAMRGRLIADQATACFNGIERTPEELRQWETLILTGCGTSFNAALAGEYIIEFLSRVPVECEIASEFRYRNSPLEMGTAVFALSQSGETADTLAALRECRRRGAPTFGICNNAFSTISRESDGGIDLRAGQEVGVAATKSFTSQVLVLTMLGLMLGRMRDMRQADGAQILEALEKLPDLVALTLEVVDADIRRIAKKYAAAKSFIFLGRQANFPVALEGALKLKEISYISTCAHPSAELKHGVIALVNEETPSIFIAPHDELFEKNLGNIEEVKARNGPVIAVGTQGDDVLADLCDDVVLVPACEDFLTPILTVLPLQLLAYHIGVELGCDVDKPRNLAKSVTVE